MGLTLLSSFGYSIGLACYVFNPKCFDSIVNQKDLTVLAEECIAIFTAVSAVPSSVD
jgi:hypothetical protein